MLFKKRNYTKSVLVGNVGIGGNNMLSVQSMTNTDTRNAQKTLEQINVIAKAGADIVRVAVPDVDAANALEEITDNSPLPVVADIHFDYRLALKAIDAGVSKLRINPGNIGGKDNVKKLAVAAGEKNIPIRIGVNAGSLEKELFHAVQNKNVSLANAMCASALKQAEMLENFNFNDIIISVKASSVTETLHAYELLSQQCDYPLHIGITEAGTAETGIIKSSIGIGALLAEGIGDTLRVSLTDKPEKEVIVGRKILQALNLRPYGPEIISCPTCGRTEIDLQKIVNELEKRIECDKTLKNKNCVVAVMGCVVNGPGEASVADLGFAGGKNSGVIFKHGKKLYKVAQENAVNKLIDEIKSL